MFGGAVPDAMLAAIRMLATLWNPDGSVAIAGLTSHEADTPEYGEALLRHESGLLEDVSAIGTGTELLPPLVPARRHRHRHRRPERPERVQHPRPERARPDQRARRPRTDRRGGLRRDRGAPESERPVRRAPRIRGRRPRRAVPGRHQRLGDPRRARDHARDLGRGTGRHGIGRIDPVHRRSRRPVPGRADPGHRRRGSRHASAQPQRIAAPAELPEGDPRRGAAAVASERARTRARHRLAHGRIES